MGIRDLSGWPAIGMTVMATAILGHMSSALAGKPCGTSPSGQTEPGTHWYYHTGPVDHRQCWHLERLPRLAQHLEMRAAQTAPQFFLDHNELQLDSELQRAPRERRTTSDRPPTHLCNYC
jgi:hypothetical protein